MSAMRLALLALQIALLVAVGQPGAVPRPYLDTHGLRHHDTHSRHPLPAPDLPVSAGYLESFPVGDQENRPSAELENVLAAQEESRGSSLVVLDDGIEKRAGGGFKRLMVRVDPHVVRPNKYQAASVVCSATAGFEIEDLPYISFYWLFHDDALVPITSSIPGVNIEPVEGDNAVYSQRLTITYPLYAILESGANRFICMATNMSGQRVQQEFVIRKF